MSKTMRSVLGAVAGFVAAIAVMFGMVFLTGGSISVQINGLIGAAVGFGVYALISGTFSKKKEEENEQ